MALALVLPLVAGSVGAVYAVAFGLSAGAVLFNPASLSAVGGRLTGRPPRVVDLPAAGTVTLW